MLMMLTGILHGFEENPDLPPETIGNGYGKGSMPLPHSWEKALDHFKNGGKLSSKLGEDFSKLYTELKFGELKRFRSIITPHEYDWYLHNV